ncbi:bifunctional folylpolyglutamate synthase/dihydrofolate synthase [Bacillus sp. CGMCC 1.16607]|uniref:bifunctional folylpolyglutamate synthase/dihydrofolate synthase n=1 Tax=Bacillus sp. CGMCC 1.16607 TaxID=3351842 RepID=UPI003641CEF4
MLTTYKEAINWIHSRLRLGIKPGLKRMEWMMERLGSPHNQLKTIHIGGTNGKGSTVTFLRNILQSSGFEVGTFTSPYIEQFNERISVNGIPISDDEIVELTNLIIPLADELEGTELGAPTEFEVITAMSFYYFAKLHPVDVVIYEVGLGGRFDSTNIIHPLLSIITSIGLDHTSILGETYEEIAFEKAGIIKNGVGVISAVKQNEAREVIMNQALLKKASIYQPGNQYSVTSTRSLVKGEEFSITTPFKSLNHLEIGMMGQHQVDNASLAVMASIYLNQFYSFMIEEEHIRSGLKAAFWPGRMEIIQESPLVVMDGAHNEEGISALVKVIESRFNQYNIKIIFTALADKALDGMIGQLDKVADQLYFVEFDYPRASKALDLFEKSHSQNKSYTNDWKNLLVEQIDRLGQEEILVITGSLYFISEVKGFLTKK